MSKITTMTSISTVDWSINIALFMFGMPYNDHDNDHDNEQYNIIYHSFSEHVLTTKHIF
jgi:TRAP-type mannitol/chloroaromatic compound transport system permease small subunit